MLRVDRIVAIEILPATFTPPDYLDAIGTGPIGERSIEAKGASSSRAVNSSSQT
jgi:hypothetical protein